MIRAHYGFSSGQANGVAHMPSRMQIVEDAIVRVITVREELDYYLIADDLQTLLDTRASVFSCILAMQPMLAAPCIMSLKHMSHLLGALKAYLRRRCRSLSRCVLPSGDAFVMSHSMLNALYYVSTRGTVEAGTQGGKWPLAGAVREFFAAFTMEVWSAKAPESVNIFSIKRHSISALGQQARRVGEL